MIQTLYEPFHQWLDCGLVYILSALHFYDVSGYTLINLRKIIKEGVLADVPSVHRMTIARTQLASQLCALRWTF